MNPRVDNPSLKTWTLEPNTNAKHEDLPAEGLSFLLFLSSHELKEKGNGRR